MIAVPSDIMSRFQIFLDRKPVPKQLQAHYKKWFRYYWGFCHKYDPTFKFESLHLFLDKLRQKKANGVSNPTGFRCHFPLLRNG